MKVASGPIARSGYSGKQSHSVTSTTRGREKSESGARNKTRTGSSFHGFCSSKSHKLRKTHDASGEIQGKPTYLGILGGAGERDVLAGDMGEERLGAVELTAAATPLARVLLATHLDPPVTTLPQMDLDALARC